MSFGVAPGNSCVGGELDTTPDGPTWWGTISPPGRWDASTFGCIPVNPVLTEDPLALVVTEDAADPVLIKDPGGAVLIKDPVGAVLTDDPVAVFTDDSAGAVLTDNPVDPAVPAELSRGPEPLQPPMSKTSAMLMEAVAAAPRRM